MGAVFDGVIGVHAVDFSENLVVFDQKMMEKCGFKGIEGMVSKNRVYRIVI